MQRGVERGMKKEKSSEEMIRSLFADGNAFTVKVRVPGLPHLVIQQLFGKALEEVGLNVEGIGGGASQVNFPTMLKFEGFAQKLGLNIRFCSFEEEGGGKTPIWSLVGCYCNLYISFEEDGKFMEDYLDVFTENKGWTPLFLQLQQT